MTHHAPKRQASNLAMFAQEPALILITLTYGDLFPVSVIPVKRFSILKAECKVALSSRAWIQ